MSLAAGEVNAAGFGVAVGVVRGAGVAPGAGNRPRRCKAVGEADPDEIGVDVTRAVADCSAAADLRGVIIGLGVDVAIDNGVCVADFVSDGTGVAEIAVDVAEVPPAWVVGFDVAAVFTNFFGGAFEGGVASDFILSRVFLAAS